MNTIQHALNWFEIPVEDMDRARQFYSQILNQEIPMVTIGGMELGPLPVDRESGGVGGGLVKSEENPPSSSGTTVYLNGGSDLSSILGRVHGAGGQVILEKTFGGDEVGYFALFIDSEGNKVGLHSPG